MLFNRFRRDTAIFFFIMLDTYQIHALSIGSAFGYFCKACGGLCATFNTFFITWSPNEKLSRHCLAVHCDVLFWRRSSLCKMCLILVCVLFTVKYDSKMINEYVYLSWFWFDRSLPLTCLCAVFVNCCRRKSTRGPCACKPCQKHLCQA